MKSNRRDFLKITGIGSLGILAGCTSNKEIESALSNIKEQADRTRTQHFNMHGFAAPAIDVVRVGVTGLGMRGSGTARRFASIENVEVVALNDVRPEMVERSIESISDSHSPEGYSDGPDDWKRMCEREDIDLICIATPWHLHAEQAIYAMEHGKHVYCELPIANTIEECWNLVETSERTQRHCVQMSDSCHSGNAALILNMVRKGLFGETIHAEGGYIHDLLDSHIFRKDTYHELWRLHENIDRNGNLYPQHPLMPMAQVMDINNGDKMDYLISMQSNDFIMAEKAKELAAEDDFWKPFVDRNYRGNMNTTLIRTHNGKTMNVQHDVSTPRPGIRFHLLNGTKASYLSRPGRIGFSYEDGWIAEEEYDALVEEYTPRISKVFDDMIRMANETRRAGHSYEQVNAMDWRLIDCIRNGIPVEVDVYDSVVTSAVIPLSEWSVANGSMPVKVPDFTGGSWETNKRGMNVNLETGGGNTRIR